MCVNHTNFFIFRTPLANFSFVRYRREIVFKTRLHPVRIQDTVVDQHQWCTQHVLTSALSDNVVPSYFFSISAQFVVNKL